MTPWARMGSAACALAAAMSAAHAGNIRFGATLLPQGFWANGLNDLGQIAGHAVIGTRPVAALHDRGVVTDIGSMLGPGDSSAEGINNAGNVTGNYHPSFGASRLFVRFGSQWRVDGSDGTFALAINPQGQVAGSLARTGDPFLCECRLDVFAFYLPLGLPGQVSADGNAINALSEVAGTAWIGTSARAMRFGWYDLRETDLGTLAGGSGISWSAGINAAGQVVGASTNTRGGLSAFVTRAGQMSELPNPPGDSRPSAANGINDIGQIVGQWTDSPTLHRAFLFGGGTMIDLASVVDPPLPQPIESARAINAHGQIIARTTTVPSTGLRSVLLTPAGLLEWTGSTGNRRLADPLNWDSGLGFAPNPLLDATIGATGSSVLMDAPAAARSLELTSGASLTLAAGFDGALSVGSGGLQLRSGGSLSGNGVVVGSVNNAGVIRPSPGGSITLRGAVVNAGLVEAPAGTGLSVTGAFANQPGGLLRVADTGASASGGLTNSSRVELVASVPLFPDRPSTTLRGNVVTTAGSVVLASGGQRADLTGSLIHAGDLQAIANTRVVYGGAVSGSGSFSTDASMARHRFVGPIGPGRATAPIGRMTIGNVEWQGRLTMELGVPKIGSGRNDLIVYSGSVAYLPGSTLEVRLTGGLQPKAGDAYTLFVNMPVGKTFFSTVTLPPLAAGLSWDVDGLRNDGVLRVSGP